MTANNKGILMKGSIKPADLPSPPQTALQVLKACSNDDVDYLELTSIVTNDPQLTAEILRMVNSAFYARNTPVTSLNQAISIIGTKSLRNLCLCLSVKDVFSAEQFSEDILSDFWTDSIYRAVVARHIAEISELDKDECFTAALLQDFGFLIMLYLNPDKVNSWYALRQLEPDKRLTKEKTIFSNTHTEVFKTLGKEWSLPDSIVDAVTLHHNCDDSENINVCKILNAADWFAYVISSDDINRASSACKKHIGKVLQLSDETIDGCFSHGSELVKSAADGMGIKLNLKNEYKELLQQSNIKLAEDNLNIQELNWKLQETIHERDKLSEELDNELKVAAEIQESLLPSNKDLPLHGFNLPAKQLSGDFYDYFMCDDGSILFCLADVSGKGVNASLLMVKASSLFHCLGKYVKNLEKLVNMINHELVETSIRGMFVTFICGRYDPVTASVEVINAGHPPALIISEDSKVKINSTSIPLGIDENTKFKTTRHSVKDAYLYMYTDGIFEAESDGEDIGITGLSDYFSEISSLNVAVQLLEIKKKLTSNMVNSFDDMTLLIIDGKRLQSSYV